MRNKEGLASVETAVDCSEDIAKAIGILFASRTAAHILHLKTTSYAAHKALKEFYDEVVDLADDLAEAAQGQYGILNVPFVNVAITKDPVTTLQGHLKQLDAVMANCDEDYLMSSYQEIQSLYRSTLYKLINLS